MLTGPRGSRWFDRTTTSRSPPIGVTASEHSQASHRRPT